MKQTVLFMAIFGIFGCSSINFSLVHPGANNFHPKTIGVIPATVGEYEAARDIIDVVVSKSLTKRDWFENVVDASTIKTQLETSPELTTDLSNYIQKMNTLGISDPVLVSKLKSALNADALFLTYVTAWSYGRMEGSKVGRVGLGVKLVDAGTGTIMWKANHEMVEDYWFFKPKLEDMAKDVLDRLLVEMPHAKLPEPNKKPVSETKPESKSEPTPEIKGVASEPVLQIKPVPDTTGPASSAEPKKNGSK